MNDPLKHLTWSDNFAKPRSARSDVKNNLNFTESDEESGRDLLVQSVAAH